VVAVTLSSPFALPHSQFNAFLFASIGKEGNGMPLSVVSALARLEMDPWQEAARLSDLPKGLAAAALDRLIRRLPGGGWDQAEVADIAARLIDLLPHHHGVARSDEASSGSRKKAGPPAVVWMIVVALGAAAIFGALANSAQHWDDRGAATDLSGGTGPPAQP
jgi:hypothetical protein